MDTIAAVLYVKNPLRMRDLGDDWGTDKLLNALTIKTDKMEYGDFGPGLFVDQIFTKEEASAIRNLINKQTEDKPLKERDIAFNEYLKVLINAKGYDGIVYRNNYEGIEGHDPRKDSYIVWNNNQWQQVDGNGNPDMRDINYNASADGPIEIAIADDFLSTNEKMSRQDFNEHNRNMDKVIKATEKFSAMEGEISLTDISYLGKWFSYLSTIARKYGVVSTMWNSIDFMQKLAQNFQSQFAIATKDAFMIYELLGEDAVFLDKAFSISQSSPGQYRPDANGNITFVAPESKTCLLYTSDAADE